MTLHFNFSIDFLELHTDLLVDELQISQKSHPNPRPDFLLEDTIWNHSRCAVSSLNFQGSCCLTDLQRGTQGPEVLALPHLQGVSAGVTGDAPPPSQGPSSPHQAHAANLHLTLLHFESSSTLSYLSAFPSH